MGTVSIKNERSGTVLNVTEKPLECLYSLDEKKIYMLKAGAQVPILSHVNDEIEAEKLINKLNKQYESVQKSMFAKPKEYFSTWKVFAFCFLTIVAAGVYGFLDQRNMSNSLKLKAQPNSYAISEEFLNEVLSSDINPEQVAKRKKALLEITKNLKTMDPAKRRAYLSSTEVQEQIKIK